MKRVISAAALLAVFSISLCVGRGQMDFAHAKETKARRAALHASLKFSLSFEQESRTYKLNDPITVSFSLENTGKRPAWVNKRFYLTQEVTLTVTGPTGEPLPCTFTSQSGFPKSEYFQRLQGGQTVSAEHPCDLRNYFNLTTPGRYAVVGVYENVFGQEIGLDAFTGPVTSKPVTFTVVE